MDSRSANRRLWGLVATITVLAAVGWLTLADSPSSSAELPSAPRRWPAPAEPRASAADVVPTSDDADATDEPLTDAEEELEDVPVPAVGNLLAAALARHFAAEERDEAWAPMREEQVAASFERDAPESLRHIECRRDLCRLEIHADMERLLPALRTLRSIDGDYSPSPAPVDGAMELWLSRAGRRLSDPEDPSRSVLPEA